VSQKGLAYSVPENTLFTISNGMHICNGGIMENKEISNKISHSFRNSQVGFIAYCIEPVGGMMTLSDVFSMIQENDEISTIPVESNTGVAGLVSLKTLTEKKDSFWSSLKNSEISSYINSNTVSIDATENINIALQILLSYGETAFDDFIITHKGRYLGVGSFLRLTDHIAKQRHADLIKAREVQSFLMRNTIKNNGRCSVRTYVKTANEVGGDYFIAHEIRKGLSMVCCFDVSGKNVSASLSTSMLGSFFSTMIATKKITELSPCEIIHSLNAVAFDQTPADIFITGTALFFDEERSIIECYNMGHTPTYVFINVPDGKKGIKILNPNIIPLGIEEAYSAEKSVQKIPVLPGVKIFLYTDGLEDMHDSKGERFGNELLKKFLMTNYSNSAEAIIAGLENEITSFTKGAVLPDDIAVVIAEYQ
jgi:phosphoserine phosphatase RsbU/P